MSITRINPEYQPKLSTALGTLTSSVGTFASGHNWVRRYGNIVQFYAAISLTSATRAWHTAIVNFPAGFRPGSYTLMTFALGSQGSVKSTYLGAVDAGGNLDMDANFASGSYIQFGGVFIV